METNAASTPHSASIPSEDARLKQKITVAIGIIEIIEIIAIIAIIVIIGIIVTGPLNKLLTPPK